MKKNTQTPAPQQAQIQTDETAGQKVTRPEHQADMPILEKILTKAAEATANGRRCLAIFDLDQTLFDLSARVQNIVRAFTCDPSQRERFPAACSLVEKAQVFVTDWGIEGALTRAGLDLQEHSDFIRDLHLHWEEFFFSNHYLHADEPLKGAVEFTQALVEHDVEIIFLSGRDVARMSEGTLASLKFHKFPINEGGENLVLKPLAEMDDAEFKLAFISGSIDDYDQVWLFENEPVNLNLIRANCPSVELIFVETSHSGREQVPEDLPRIRSFSSSIL